MSTTGRIVQLIEYEHKRHLRQSRLVRRRLYAALRHACAWLAVVALLWLWAGWAMGLF